ncbi:acyl-CoA N-acyltransferase [Nitzschia inconspicua]|uniref:Histone acetyltransferase n=1 Tax=Nitzschia inconspicua TaxID=303405 RepID=A0A9K3PV18_9STRA|nr:acyl-CoA N-acyltransferase [Nitzschia inconspicua]
MPPKKKQTSDGVPSNNNSSKKLRRSSTTNNDEDNNNNNNNNNNTNHTMDVDTEEGGGSDSRTNDSETNDPTFENTNDEDDDDNGYNDEEFDDDNNNNGRGRVSLSVNTATEAPAGTGTAERANSTTSTSKTTPRTPSTTTAAMDNHPYARGAVIEVLHGVKESNAEFVDEQGEMGDGSREKTNNDFIGFSKEDEDWWNQDSDDEGDENVGNGNGRAAEKYDNVQSDDGEQKVTVRLCDIIDRVPVTSDPGRYRYYVHYRDFNRRMDEWVSMERIISPPSVGNAKARAIKREEEKRKKEEERRKKAEEEKIIDVTAPRATRRRATTMTPGGATTPVFDEGDGGDDEPRRRPRRRSVDPEDTMNTASGNTSGSGETGGTSTPPPPVMAAEKGVVALPTAAAKTQIGEHVVQTIAAQELDEHEGLDDAALREHEEVTKVKNVSFVELGPYQMETWYFSPLPKELLSERGFIEVLYVCEFTFQMFARKSELRRFQSRIPTERRHPPGNEIYRNGNLSMFEVDGFEERIYCQNLCYIAKLFLDHKTLYFDVDPFLFYVLCEVDDRGFHPVGYYSKEKYSDVGYNLACILTFPSHQRKGYGRFLIAFSYELSKKEEKVGSPEKPMSDLGQQAYKPYWASTIVDFLLNQCPDANSLSIMDISKKTSIMAEDIVFTLNQLSILKIINGVYFIAAEDGLLRTLAKKYPVKEPRVDPSKLHWTPFITEVKKDKFSIHSKKPSVEGNETRGAGGFP